MTDAIPRGPLLVGRKREQAALRRALDEMLSGHGSLVLVSGEAGIGKTSLVEWLAIEADGEGCLVLTGRCYDLTETPPYGPWHEALSPVPDAADVFAGPDFARHDAHDGQPPIFSQVRAALTDLVANRPLVLVLEDLHWADPASLDLLRTIARGLEHQSLLLLVTYRDAEVTRNHPLYSLVPLLVREARAERLALHPLERAALRSLVAQRYLLPKQDAARLVDELARRSDGNPFFVGELIRSLEETGQLREGNDGWELDQLSAVAVPPLLRQVIDDRVDRLGIAARELLVTAAMIGQTVPLDLWQAVSGVDQPTMGDLVEQAMSARMLVETPDGAAVRFVHALIREALYEGTPTLRRRVRHREVAEALLAAPQPDPDAVADHLQRAGDSRAPEWLIKAGERARRVGASETAAARFRAAIDLLGSDQPALAGSLALQIGYLLRKRRTTLPEVIRALREAIQFAAEADDPVMAGVARCQLGYALSALSEWGAITELRAGVATLEAVPVEAWERTAAPRDGVMVASLADARMLLAWSLSGVAPCTEALALLGGTLDVPLETLTYYGLLTVYQLATTLGQPEIARRAHQRLRQNLRAPEDAWVLATTLSGHFNRSVLVYSVDDPVLITEELGTLRRAWSLAEELQFVDPVPLDALQFQLELVRGDWAAAEAHARIVRALPPISFAGLTLATIAWLRGDRDAAWEELRRWLPDGAAHEPRAIHEKGEYNILPVLRFLKLGGHLQLDAGDVERARSWAEASDRWLAWSGAVLGQAENALLWARFHELSDNSMLARKFANQALAHATDPRQPLALVAVHRFLGRLDTIDKRVADAEAHLHESLELADACAAPFERALTLLEIAALRLSQRRIDEAIVILADVQAICQPLEARPTLERVETLRQQISLLPARAPAYPAGLTLREVEVLRLVAEGMTDSEVAERLFVSRRTVTSHLTNVFNKLEVSNRAAAVAVAAQHGLL